MNKKVFITNVFDSDFKEVELVQKFIDHNGSVKYVAIYNGEHDIIPESNIVLKKEQVEILMKVQECIDKIEEAEKIIVEEKDNKKYLLDEIYKMRIKNEH